MKTRLLIALCLLLSAALGIANAQGLTATGFSEDYVFAESITLGLTAAGDSPITQATVYYQMGGAPPIGIPARSFEPATAITVTAVIALDQSPPTAFTTVRYWWELADRAGNQLRTDTRSFTYIDNRYEWQSLTDDQVRVHWYAGDSAVASSAAQIANEALPRLRQQVGSEVPTPIDMYIYANVADLRSAVEGLGRPWLGGQARPELGVVMIVAAADDTVNVQLRRDVPHELTHLMVYVATTPNYASVPAWLDEGLATFNEQEPNAAQAVAIQTLAAANELPPLEALCGNFPVDGQAALAAYGQSASVVQQIIDTHGSAGVQALLAAYKDGVTCAAGVERGLNATLAGLDLQWRSNMNPTSGVSTVAKGSAPWMILVLIVLLPLLAAALFIRKPAR